MKKIAGCFNIFIILLFLANCEHPTFDCVIQNISDYPAELVLTYHKKATNTNNDTIVLQPKQATTVAFYYEGDNVKLVSKNRNQLKKDNKKYTIENSMPKQIQVFNTTGVDVFITERYNLFDPIKIKKENIITNPAVINVYTSLISGLQIVCSSSPISVIAEIKDDYILLKL